MSEPHWIDCITPPPAAELARLVTPERHVVLRFPRDPAGVLAQLRAALPQLAVFRSGERSISLVAVVADADIAAQREAIIAAVADYQRCCAGLVAGHTLQLLPAAWQANEHGEHCRFAHARTGQIVEAPLHPSAHVDPAFFAEFVQTTPAHAGVAALVRSFHDAARLLDRIR